MNAAERNAHDRYDYWRNQGLGHPEAEHMAGIEANHDRQEHPAMSSALSITPIAAHSEIRSFWLRLGMSERTALTLANENLGSYDDVRAVGALGLLRVPNFGRKSLMELQDLLGPLNAEASPHPTLLAASDTALLIELQRRLARGSSKP